MNPDFLLELGKELDGYFPFEPSKKDAHHEADPILKTAMQLFETIQRAIPGSLDAWFYLSKIKYLAGDLVDALSIVEQILTTESTFSQAHILNALILYEQKNYKRALQALDSALSSSFEVRKIPTYSLIRGRALKALGEHKEAAILLEEIVKNGQGMSDEQLRDLFSYGHI